MTRHRRQRSDSIAASVAAHQAIRQGFEPPQPIPANLRPLWDEISCMRAVHEWTPLDLRLAVTLVLALGGLEEQQTALARENLLRRTKHGLSPNARLELVERLQRRVFALQSRLLLDPRAFGLRSDRTAAARKLEREARARVDPVGSYLDNGGDPMALLIDDGRAFLAGPEDTAVRLGILPGSDDDAETVVGRFRARRGNGKH